MRSGLAATSSVSFSGRHEQGERSMAVAITGLGVISPYGAGSSPLMNGLLQGSMAPRLRRSRNWPSPGVGPTIASIDERTLATVLGDERRRGLNAETITLLAAARLAIADAGLEHVQGDGTGVVVSTRHAGLQDYAELFLAGTSKEIGAVNPARGPQTGLNAPAAHLSIRLSARGPNMTMSNGAVGGLDALSYAVDTLRASRAETMLVGGVDVLPRVAGALLAEQAIPAGVPCARPFDRRRCGSMLGEAGVTVILENRDHAKRRGARIRAEVSAVASAFSPRDDLAEASRRSLTNALDACSTDRRTVVAGFAGANGSVAGDAAEAQALHELLGDRVSICAIKGAVADSAGAGALTQVAVAALSLEHQMVPPTIGFRLRDPDLPTLMLSTSPQALASGPIVVHTWDEACCAASAVLHSHRPAARPRASAGRRSHRAH
jgi:3-oxoacyl-[acyl-carrier-protein] synthase II